MSTTTFDFIGGTEGPWKVTHIATICGAPFTMVSAIDIQPHTSNLASLGTWVLTGFTSNIRYAEKEERAQLAAVQPDLGRPQATLAALIPLRKREEWWNLAQDERRNIFEAQSHHTATGLKYLPAIARKLYHCRDLGQPFDFLTWFEFAPEDEEKFNELLVSLRSSEEWKYIDREIDIRLIKNI